MRSFVDNARTFRDRMAADGRTLAPLAHGQQPLALFITCSDSRVIPSLITGAEPGELFELRTAGGIVPRYDLTRPSGEAATIEFAVQVLGVADIVVCGHSQCAAVAARVRGDDLSHVPAMNGWLTHSATGPAYANRPANRPANQPAAPSRPATTDGTAEATASATEAATEAEAQLAEAVRHHVLAQLDRLRGYPCVADRLHDGRIGLHGWYYEVHTGTVLAHHPAPAQPQAHDQARGDTRDDAGDRAADHARDPEPAHAHAHAHGQGQGHGPGAFWPL
ncbi:carbonic anhydrase [Spirillospora sp. CA-255316]